MSQLSWANIELIRTIENIFVVLCIHRNGRLHSGVIISFLYKVKNKKNYISYLVVMSTTLWFILIQLKIQFTRSTICLCSWFSLVYHVIHLSELIPSICDVVLLYSWWWHTFYKYTSCNVRVEILRAF